MNFVFFVVKNTVRAPRIDEPKATRMPEHRAPNDVYSSAGTNSRLSKKSQIRLRIQLKLSGVMV